MKKEAKSKKHSQFEKIPKIKYERIFESSAYSISNWYMYILISIILGPLSLIYCIYSLTIKIKHYKYIKDMLNKK